MWTYVKERLGESTTQHALSVDFAALLAALSGTTSWQLFVIAAVGTLPALLTPVAPGK